VFADVGIQFQRIETRRFAPQRPDAPLFFDFLTGQVQFFGLSVHVSLDQATKVDNSLPFRRGGIVCDGRFKVP